MRNDDVIVIGDKIELAGEDDRIYKTMVEDMTGNGFFLIGVPSYGGIPLRMQTGDNYSVFFSRESGKYRTYMTVAGFEKRGHVRYAWLMQRSSPGIYQRREAFRLPVTMKVLIFEYDEDAGNDPQNQEGAIGTVELETGSSKDISITGISLVVRRKFELRERVLLKPIFSGQPEPPAPFIVGAEVVRSIPESYRGRHCLGTQFFGQTKSMHEYLAKYVLTQQQKQIRQRKFLDS